jgi:hypothetical protein
MKKRSRVVWCYNPRLGRCNTAKRANMPREMLRMLRALAGLSTPRVYRYIGTLMEQPLGLSMVN